MYHSCHIINKGVSFSQLPEDRELFTSCPRVNRLLVSLRAAGCFRWHWLMRENVRMNNCCGFAVCSVTTCASWSDSNESECSSLPAGFLLRDFVTYIKEGFLGAEVTLGQGSLCWLALVLIEANQWQGFLFNSAMQWGTKCEWCGWNFLVNYLSLFCNSK